MTAHKVDFEKPLQADDMPDTAALLAHAQEILEIPESEMELWRQAREEGDASLGGIIGLSEPMYNTIESIALGLFRSKRYDEAAEIYSFILKLNLAHASAWRGMGACHHSLKNYEQAVICYANAYAQNPKDAVSKFLLGECLCFLGETQDGLDVLKEALTEGEHLPEMRPYLRRARAIVQAQTSTVAADVARQSLKGLVHRAAEQMENAAAGDEQADLSAVAELLKDPVVGPRLTALTAAVTDGELTLKDVAGFTDEQMHAGYAMACTYLQRGEVPEAVQVLAWLIYADEHNPKYYHLAGICMHHLKIWCMADYMYALALIYEPKSPENLIYRGEAKLMNDERDVGLKYLNEGLALAANNPQHQDVVARGRHLLKQFGG